MSLPETPFLVVTDVGHDICRRTPMTMSQIYRISPNLWDRMLHCTFSKLGLAVRTIISSDVETVLQGETTGACDAIATI